MQLALLPMAFLLFLLLARLSFVAQAAEISRVCNIEIHAEETIDFSGTEESWLCGDPASHGWKSIPLNQQKFFLESFLQSRGYHGAEIQEEGALLKVNAGAPLEVQRFTVIGAPREWNWAKKWDLHGEPFAPATVDQASAWARRELQERGFPCATATSLALTPLQEIRTTVEPGEPFQFGEIETAGNSELDPAILERFSAFVEGQTFDVRLLELTSSRILQEDLYLSSYFDVICNEGEPVRLVRRSVPALPRLFTVGAGFDTEQGPIARSRLKWARLSPAASSLELSLLLSLRQQEIEGRFPYFFLNDLRSRLHVIPFLQVRRLSERRFTSLTTQLGARLAHSWEREDFQFQAEAGPLFERVHTTKGLGPRKLDQVKWSAKLMATSHLFEYYLSDPRQGWTASIETSSQVKGLLAEENAQRIFFQHQILWNLGRWDPPFLVLGWRGFLGSYLLANPSKAERAVPADQRFFLGGDENIRGFSRKEIPGSEGGFLTVLYQGLELRTGGWLPFQLQPFLLFDWAKGGKQDLKLSPAQYHAPGIGVRWQSPVGTIRSTLAHGFVSHRDREEPAPESHLQFFFSFGREF